MKSRKPTGLVGFGGVNQSFLSRIPGLLEQLGPVKGSSLKVSRRIANGLRAGFGVAEYSALEACGIIWVYAPENALDCISSQLASAIPLTGKILVLCDALRDSLQPGPLRMAGGRVVTVNCVPESHERKFVGEGHPAALSELRKLLAQDHRKLLELLPGGKPLYLAGLHLGTHLLLPWIAGATESLRAAGVPRAEAVKAVDAWGTRALRAYGKAGNKALDRVAAQRSNREVARYLETLRLTDIRIAALFTDGNDRLLRYFAKPVRRQKFRVMAQSG
jgi:hypothetical protein